MVNRDNSFERICLIGSIEFGTLSQRILVLEKKVEGIYFGKGIRRN